MADSARVATLRASLLRELEAACPIGTSTPTVRLRWLHRELENYLDRWLAFAALDSIPLKSLLNDDLFAMVLVATDVCAEEFARLSNCDERKTWDIFAALLVQVRAKKSRSFFPALRPALDDVGVAISHLSLTR